MQYNITESLPIWFEWSIFIYTQWELYMEAKIKKPLEEEKKISDFVFQTLKQEFQESKDKEVKKAREQGMILDFIQNLDKIFSDEDIEKVLTWFEAFDIMK